MTNDTLMFNGTADGPTTDCTDDNYTVCIEPEPVIEKAGFRRGDIAWCAGKVVRVWDYWYGVWVIWFAPEPCILFNELFKSSFLRRFRGLNRGRHWNRTR